MCKNIYGIVKTTINSNKPNSIYKNVELGKKKQLRKRLNNVYFSLLSALHKFDFSSKSLGNNTRKLNKVCDKQCPSIDSHNSQEVLKALSVARKDIKVSDEYEDIRIITKPEKVLKEAVIFWVDMFKSYKTKLAHKPYWFNRTYTLINTNILTDLISIKELKEAITDLKLNKATGTDDIPPDFYKNLDASSVAGLLKLYNVCLTHKQIPAVWKHSRIFPIFKGGNMYNQSNFRPICLLQIQYKIFLRALGYLPQEVFVHL